MVNHFFHSVTYITWAFNILEQMFCMVMAYFLNVAASFSNTPNRLRVYKESKHINSKMSETVVNRDIKRLYK